ncbi:MAG: hypothetical protein PVJ38_06635 [Candidatus Bathyarchaeota archaeon]
MITPLTSASDRIYDGTIVGVNPEDVCPVRITYRYSRRRNKTVAASICDQLNLNDLMVGMAVKWMFLDIGEALIVGPIAETTSDEPPPDSQPQGSGGGSIERITIRVEGEGGESIMFELNESDWSLDGMSLELSFRGSVSSILEDAVYEKTLMFVTHISPDMQRSLETCIEEARFNVWEWNYVFPDFPIWGDYFNYETPDSEINRRLEGFEGMGFKNVLYVDLTECHRSISDRWGDSVIESGDWWSLMTLDPSKSWYQYIKAGMLDMTKRFPSIDGFAIDRLDRCSSEQEERWAAQLLDEVKDESEMPVKYVMNSLQPWMTDLASRAVFIGSDGVDTQEPTLSRTIEDYERLASHTETGMFYINPYMGKTDAELIKDYERILEAHDFTFIDDYYLRLLDDIFPG